MMPFNNKKWIWDIIFVCLCAGAAVFLLWKCRYGFANMDESNYLATPFRILQGDGMLVQEWHLTQLAGFLLYPVMKIYMLIAGGTEGIFLTFRYIYTAFQIIVSVFIYIRFRKINQAGAIAAALVFMLYAPFGIMALSYNSLGIANLVISLTIILTAKRAKRLQDVIAGLFFAASVLCCPYLIVVYALYTLVFVITAVRRRVKGILPENTVFCIRHWLFFSIGAAILAVIFAVFVLSRAGIKDILAALPYILTDSSHETKGLAELAVTYVKSVLRVSRPADICYALLVIAFVAALIDRKSSEHAFIYFAAATVFTAAAIIFTAVQGRYINFVMFPVNIMAPVCAVICRDRTARKLLILFWIPAMIYTVCIHMASNMEFYAISSASAAAAVSSLIIVALCAGDIMKDCDARSGYTAAVCAAVILAGQTAVVAVMRYEAVFWGSMEILQNETQKTGVEKGLFIPDAAEEEYINTLKLSDYLEEHYPGEKELLILSDSIWIYLQCPEKRNASFSGWLAELGADGIVIEQNVIDKLMSYYELNPHKIPDLIYVEARYEEFIDDMNTLAEYETIQLDINGAVLLVRG